MMDIQEVRRRGAAAAAIQARYRGHQFTSLQCVLCNWSSNGLTLDEAVEANRAHQESHPDWAEWEATDIPMLDLVASLHADHECVFGQCECRCGCTEASGCKVLMGPLCSVCMVREMRGHRECGRKEETP